MLGKVSAFTQELIDDVARNRYSFGAWRTLLSRAWVRSLEDMRTSPTRTKSFWSWVAIIGAMGSSIVLLTLWLQTIEQALTAFVLWLPWYIGAAFFVLTHLGMVDDSDGVPHQRLLLPNGLSFARLALAPLVLWPCLQAPVDPIAGIFFALFLTGLLLSDLLDGWIARHQNICTRMGGVLDPLADLALITFLAFGLYLAGYIPGQLLCLLVVRYPILLLGVLILFFVREPAPLRPTLIGKVTTFVTSVVLLTTALTIWLPTAGLPPSWIEWSVRLLYVLISANILYLIFRAVIWKSRREDSSDTDRKLAK